MGITVDRITEMGTVVVIMAVVITEVDIMEVVTTEDLQNHKCITLHRSAEPFLLHQDGGAGEEGKGCDEGGEEKEYREESGSTGGEERSRPSIHRYGH